MITWWLANKDITYPWWVGVAFLTELGFEVVAAIKVLLAITQ